MKNRCVSRRFLGIFCLALIVCAGIHSVSAYQTLNNDRLLLLNNDTSKVVDAANHKLSIALQGYYDQDTTANYYWTHDGRGNTSYRPYQAGTNHVMYAKDGTVLWQLQNCRFGSAVYRNLNYLPTSSTAQASTKGTSSVDPSATVIMQNTIDSRVISPYYNHDGVGTIYFDVVNLFGTGSAPEDPRIALEMSTSLRSGVEGSFEAITNPDDMEWQQVPFDVLVVENGAISETRLGLTNLVLQAEGERHDTYYYRVRARLDYRGPMRFRIVRCNIDETPNIAIDAIGTILIDNIQVSFPPMSAELIKNDVVYDPSLSGVDVLGGYGDFNVPFLSLGQTGVVSYVEFHLLTNSPPVRNPQATKISNIRLNYRWRYLSQIVGPWQRLDFSPTTLSAEAPVTPVGDLQLTNGVGDIEYFFSADVSGMFYDPIDYAYDFSSRVGWGVDWTEQISAITNRATYTAADALPSGGTDWFTRIREGESDYASISLVGQVTTNGAWGADMHTVENNERTKMELVGDHVWRYHYYIPTNAIGERIRFHFEGVKYVTNDVPFVFNVSTNVWYANSTNVPYLPYTMAASGSATDANNAVVELDGSATHLQIEFNDEKGAFSLSRGTYQNFNMWTDANDGYRGDYSSTTGVSDVKHRWDAEISEKWPATSYADKTLWREAFDVEDDDTEYPLYQKDSKTTPNGWSYENSMYVSRSRVPQNGRYGHALQLSGKGEGSLSLITTNGVPGVGTVAFAARVAQIPKFNGFCYDYDFGTKQNYAVSAKVTMSRLFESQFNPSDISPANPSVSLVGYYRGGRNGCYEFRVTRSGDSQLTVALYRWKNEVETLLVSNILRTTSAATLTSGQTALGVGGTLTSTPDSTSGKAISSFNNLLVPMRNDDPGNNRWTCMCLSLYTHNGQVYLDGYLSPNRDTRALSDPQSVVTRVVAYRDDSPGDLTRGGSPGVGSVGCQAGFGAVYTHDFLDPADYSRGIDIQAGHEHGSMYEFWEYSEENWRPLAAGEFGYGAGFTALIPANQKIKLLYSPVEKVGNWIDSGWETNITAFATNTFTFAPCVAPDYLVRLQTGPSDAEIVIDEVEVKSWRAVDMPDLRSKNGQYDQWAYTMASIETVANIDGAYELQTAGDTNGYVFIFNQAGMVTFTPQIDMVIDRVLLVGGGGAGGWTIGGGGGGGGVLEYDESNWGGKPLEVKADTTIRITVGAGGSANANQTKWMSGTSGGESSISSFKDMSNTTRSFTAAKGGGGGGCWGQSGTTGNQQNGKTGGSGGGSANGNGTSAAGTSGQGYAGGRSNSESPGGGGGAGGVGGAGVATSDGKTIGGTAGRTPAAGYASDGKAGNGGDGKRSDITGKWVYYGGGGGGGAGNSCYEEGAGGRGGGGRGGHGGGANVGRFTSTSTTTRGEDGTDGLGGGGGGGGFTPAKAGGNGGCGCVILRVRMAAKLCVLQPTRSYPVDGPEYKNAYYPMSIRSKWLDNGLSLFSFSYREADSNAVLRLQISTNLVDEGVVYTRTRAPADSPDWTTLTNWSFKGLSPNELKEGTRTYFLSLRAPQKGLMRLVMDPSVVTQALMQAEDRATRNLDYGKIMITRAFCYDEPELDARSWWGWNLHTEGWGGGSNPGRWAYLTDSPDGLSCSLNFSALPSDNDTSKPETYGIGLGETGEGAEESYAKNNPFVQSPEMTNGIASVSFRARTFETNATSPSVVILYGANDIGAYQPNDDDFGQVWKRLAEFVISNNTYQTYNWSTNNEGVAKNVKAVRLEVGGARHGRKPSDKGREYKNWETPTSVSSSVYEPIQRVFLDEVTVSEPVGPRLKFFDVRPFRSQLTDTSPKAIININDRDEQPLLGESWGIQARIEPQQMSDELDMNSIVVKMAAYVGKSPWGYKNWKDIPVGNNKRYEAELTCVDRTNLIFRSTCDNPASVIAPVTAQDVGERYAVVQYHVWAEFRLKDAPVSETTPHDLDEKEWVRPEWYWPMDFNKEYGLDQAENFSAFTILDTISPGRAWFNEVNYNNDDYNRDNYQFLEFMVPEGNSVDLTDWTIRLTDDTFNKGILAALGSTAQPITYKFGTRPGIDSTNHFTVVTFVAPNGANFFTENQSDGIWNKLQNAGLQLQDGSLKKGNIYGLELIRPSGVVEHQIVVSGTNMWAGSIFESKGDATNFVNDVKARDGSESWFWAGDDKGGMATTDKSLTLGVWRGHGEQLWDGLATWTNDLTATPGELNLRNGQRQFLDDWMLPPNGTNVWIYATVLGDHTWQYVDGNPANTNRNTLLVVSSGASTNIRYVVDSWYELANCKVNEDEVTPTSVPGLARTFEIALVSVTNNKTTVTVNDRGDSRLFGTNYAWQVAENDPYKPAILDWLLRNWPDKGPEDIVPVEHWNLAQTERMGYLDLREMYWMDIPPADGHIEDGKLVSDWRFLFGYTKPFAPFPTVEDGVTYANNAIGAVKLLLTNKIDGTFHRLYTIQGLQPGSSSATDYATASENWTSATFKVTCALNYGDQSNVYKPVKWFVFDGNSFNADGVAYIEVPDQSKSSTPGFNYGWSYYLGTSFTFDAKLDESPSGLYTTEILRAVHTNSYNSIVSP